MKLSSQVLLPVALVVFLWGCTPQGSVPIDEPENDTETYTIEVTDYHKPKQTNFNVLVDDRLEDKETIFDPDLVHREPLGGWSVNLSEAVIKLDIPMLKPDRDRRYLTLSPSYKAAYDKQYSRYGVTIIPSVNMLDGKAKQFDDGLYAALDQAYYEGLEGTLVSHVDLVRRIFEKVGPDSPAAPFLAAGLELAGVKVKGSDVTEKEEQASTFLARATASKPIGFYTWNDSLRQCFQFLRFFQQPFNQDNLDVPLAIAQALEADPELLTDYNLANAFYAQLTNPLKDLTVAQLIGAKAEGEVDLDQLMQQHGTDRPLVSVFPASSSREDRLFRRLFSNRPLPADANLMRELVTRIRSGEIDLSPGDNAGWYDHQVYALETMLLPELGEENNKLLLTKSYKKRMLEAFKALITKRKETHVRQLGEAATDAADDFADPGELQEIQPRLRIEPCPSYYLRTARAYSFLANMLDATLGSEALESLHGLTKDGPREPNLHAELNSMRELFYGLYLVSAEDIGLRAEFSENEPVDQEMCYTAAIAWLKTAFNDPDMARDTRVSIPIMVSDVRGKTRLWVTLGVRISKLEASFVRPPRIKPAETEGDWEEVESWKLSTADYLIPVDEFAEVEIPGNAALTRDELRAICDRHGTKEEIIEALSNFGQPVGDK